MLSVLQCGGGWYPGADSDPAAHPVGAGQDQAEHDRPRALQDGRQPGRLGPRRGRVRREFGMSGSYDAWSGRRFT